ncbi:Sorbitol dehydrogenase [compost metagenome]
MRNLNVQSSTLKIDTHENLAHAMVFTNPNTPFEFKDSFLPTLQEEEVLVKIEYTTICTSDLHTYFGRRTSPMPSILGHEIMGVIEAIGSGGKRDYSGKLLTIGDRITWMVYAFDPCCDNAQKGYPQKSENLYKYGHQKISENDMLNGGFASHCHLRKGTELFLLPNDISNQVAAPINCTHATISGAIRISAKNPVNKTCLVVGAGMLGLSACAQLKALGASKIIVMDIDAARLTYAKKFGATHAILLDKSTGKITVGAENFQGIDLAIETSGNPQTIELTLSGLAIGGVLTLVGSIFEQEDISINAETIVRNLLTIRGLHNYTPEDLKNAIDFIKKYHSAYPFHELVGAEFQLEDLTKAFEYAGNSDVFRVGVTQTSNKSLSNI